jgi:hypothetical protein
MKGCVLTIAAVLVLGLGCPALGQQGSQATQAWTPEQPQAASGNTARQGPPAAVTAKVLTNQDVLEMTKAGLPAGVIVDKISSAPCRFDTSVSALVNLKSEGVDASVLSAMIRCRPTPAAHSEPHVWVGTSDEWIAYGTTVTTANSNSTTAVATSTGKITAQEHSEYPDVTRELSEKCHSVVVTYNIADADYAVTIERYHGGHLLTQRNRFSIFRTRDGNLVMSNTTTWLRNAADDICKAILRDRGRDKTTHTHN